MTGNMALGAGIGLAMLSYPVHAAPVSGGDTVQGLYEALLSTMKKHSKTSATVPTASNRPIVSLIFQLPQLMCDQA
jgi:hypothetical protein